MPNLLKIDYDENLVYAEYKNNDRRVVFNRQYARYVRHITGFKDVITGDIFYKNLTWKKEENLFNAAFLRGRHGNYLPYWFNNNSSYKTKKGVAIERNKKIIYFDMPDTDEHKSERKVLFEKIKIVKTIEIPMTDFIILRQTGYFR